MRAYILKLFYQPIDLWVVCWTHHLLDDIIDVVGLDGIPQILLATISKEILLGEPKKVTIFPNEFVYCCGSVIGDCS
ncbi:hypothetical protein DSO57_1022031 [Entomophthora muscae]|uniref:Uncharacterized protein n=1 Tax=Entomophthora muscae TaxID=34485 RepID=A0ACC2UCW1_9FUNG|nr:hypothetical protein DSO57_1022031 [Entomophthora muscae]